MQTIHRSTQDRNVSPAPVKKNSQRKTAALIKLVVTSENSTIMTTLQNHLILATIWVAGKLHLANAITGTSSATKMWLPNQILCFRLIHTRLKVAAKINFWAIIRAKVTERSQIASEELRSLWDPSQECPCQAIKLSLRTWTIKCYPHYSTFQRSYNGRDKQLPIWA